MNIVRMVSLTILGGVCCFLGLCLIIFEIGMAGITPPREASVWLGVLVLIGFGACILYFGIWILSRALLNSDEPTIPSPQEVRLHDTRRDLTHGVHKEQGTNPQAEEPSGQRNEP